MKCEVAIIGGGPAGSTAGNLLAQRGIDAVIIEQGIFPRFHIGESLLPCDMPLFDRLGVHLDKAAYMPKQGADFIDERRQEQVTYLFKDGLSGCIPYAWQVERAEFDHALLRKAEQVGAKVFEDECVQSVAFADACVSLVTSRRTIQARYVIDASGQDAFFARRAKVVEPIKGFGRAAVFCHFYDLSDQVYQELAATGNIRVLIIEDGWIWIIPLTARRVSVGVVSRSKGLATSLLDGAIQRSPFLQRITAGARRTQNKIIRNFSYMNKQPSGPRFACVGDAACFLDPVFSSGVSLAMLGAERLADTLVDALHNHRETDPHLLDTHTDHMAHAYRSFSALIHSFYHTSMVPNLFFAADPDPEMRAGLITMLAGDLWRQDNRFQSMLQQSTRRSAPLT